MGHPDVWIVVAAFNEASVIGDVIADVRSVFDHVVCVDDGSGDGTGEIALRAGAHLVRHPVNLGQGAAIAGDRLLFAGHRRLACVKREGHRAGDHRAQDGVVAPRSQWPPRR